MADKLSRRDVIAFRLSAHHLTERLGRDGLLEAAGACGVQDSPPGSALLALNARVRDLTRDRLTEAVANRSLLRTWCMRGSPFYVSTVDAPVFTTGVLPPTEQAMRHFISGVEPALIRLGMSLIQAIELIRAQIGDVLSARRLPIDELGVALAGRIAPALPEKQRTVWEQDGPYAPDQPLGEAVVHFCMRILTVQGVVCFAPRAGNKVRCYGPSTRRDFAAWLGINAGDTDPWWRLVEDELTPVDIGGPSWILTQDLEALRSAPTPRGVRLLPPRDPYTQMRDHDTIVATPHHRDVWTTAGEPGTGPGRRQDHRHLAAPSERPDADHHDHRLRFAADPGQQGAPGRSRAGRGPARRVIGSHSLRLTTRATAAVRAGLILTALDDSSIGSQAAPFTRGKWYRKLVP